MYSLELGSSTALATTKPNEPGDRAEAAASNQSLPAPPHPPPPPRDHGHGRVLQGLWASRAAAYLRISTFPRAFSTVLKDLKYADTHEWVKVEGGSATIGITDHAQDHLGDVVYVELPEVGNSVYQGKNFGAVESVKATSDINSPVSGEVVEVNEKLSEEPGLVNASPYDKGWIIKVKLSDSGELSSLMDDEKYSTFCEEED